MKQRTTKQLRASAFYERRLRQLNQRGIPAVHQMALDSLTVGLNLAETLAFADYYSANRPAGLNMEWPEFAGRYCSRQDSTPRRLAAVLRHQLETMHPDGWMLLECRMFDGSRLGELTILPYGPSNTHKSVPDHPVSPRGLASDMSVVIGLLSAANLPPLTP